MTEQTTPVPDRYLTANPDLSGATPMQVYDACVEALTGAGLIVIPNCHTLDAGWCCSEGDESGLWFNDRWPAGSEFGNDTRSADNFGRAASTAAGWWNNVEAWLTEHDVDWCWWPLNPTHSRSTVPVTGQHRSRWGDPEPWGLLAPDWRGVANPPVLDVLRALIPARTGPGVVP
jgi:hypothetical protein